MRLRGRMPARDNAFFQAATDALRARLESSGIPKEAVVRDWAIGDRYRADMAILDVATKSPIAVIELRNSANQQAIDSARRQLESFAQAIGNPNLRQYLGHLRGDRVILYKLHGINGPEDLVESGIPDFAQMVAAGRARNLTDKQTERRAKTDHFKWICWAMAVIIVVVLVIDFFEWYPLTEERMALIGAAAALVVIPFAGKLKMLGVEFERAARDAALPTLPPVGPIPPVDPVGPLPDPRSVTKPVVERVRGVAEGAVGALPGRRKKDG